jgi:hypothetical protein
MNRKIIIFLTTPRLTEPPEMISMEIGMPEAIWDAFVCLLE